MFRNIIFKIIYLILALCFIVVAVGGYFGFVPYVSSVFGSDKPRDLGVKYSLQDSIKAQEKIGTKLVALPKDTPVTESIQFSGSRPASFTLSSNELSAWLSSRPWKYHPLSRVQVKMHKDSTIEFSGFFEGGKALSCLQATGNDPAFLKAMFDKYHLDFNKIPIYIKGKGFVKDNIVQFDVTTFELGRIALSSNIINTVRIPLLTLINEKVKTVPGVYIKDVHVQDETIVFEGTLPDKEATVNE